MSSAAKVGAFMLAVLFILGFFILKIEDVKLDRQRTMKTVEVIFDSVAGLDEKSAVRVAGVRVGKVSTIHLENGRAVVSLEIEKDVELHDGAYARVANMGMLGEKYIELVPGDANAPTITDLKGPLKGSKVASIEDVTEQISAIADDIKAVSASMKNAMGGPTGEQRLEEIVENIREITSRMKIMIAANEGNVNASADNIRAITADLRVQIPRIADSIDRFANSVSGTVGENREDVRAVVENLKGLSSDLRVSATNLNNITGQVKSGQGTIGKLVYDDAAHQQVMSTLKSVETGVDELKDTLGRARKLQMAIEVKSAYYGGLQEGDPSLGLDGNSRSGLAVVLRPDPDKNRFLQFELNGDPRGKRNEKLITTETTMPDGQTETITTHQVKYDKGYLFSAQAGWRLDKTKLRLGIFDGTGGFGADYLASDRLQLSGEVFDFNQHVGNQDPHVRLFGNYTVMKERPNFPLVFLTTGVDNALNDAAFTIGAGIRWGDDDLKYLMSSVPTH